MEKLLVELKPSTFSHVRTGEKDVSVTDNGWQWLCVFTGNEAEAEIIRDAYIKVGYKLNKK